MIFSKRRTLYQLKRWMILCLLLWTSFCILVIWKYSEFNFYLSRNVIPLEIQNEISNLLDSHYPKFETNINESESTTYLKIFQDIDNIQAELFHIMKDYSLQERCDLYFSNVDTKNGIIVDPEYDFKYDKFNYLDWDEYRRDSLNKLKEELDDEFYDFEGNELEDRIRVKYEIAKMKNEADEQLLHDYFLHVKIFNKCYIDGNNDFIEEQKQLLSGINLNGKVQHFIPRRHSANVKALETKVFPWLTQKFPYYDLLLTGEITTLEADSNSFLHTQKNVLSGKGIVITISDSHLDDCIRLIHLLRYLDNKLPIQIIHTGLSDVTKNQLRQASTSDFQGKTHQNVTLVNVTPAIEEKYLHKFDKFGHKILAVLFNTFQEIMLLDADTVLTQKPAKFFKLKKYKKSGTLFYRDRNTAEYRPGHDITMFLKLMNTNMDSKLFDLPQISNKTMDMPLFSQKISHIMESGLVLINRKSHFGQSLIMANMYFFHPITDRIYGDKEMFWLSLSILGDEDFEFNKHPAAAIGQITPYQERIKGLKTVPESLISKEICSNHPAHINDEDNHTLLWFNSGFKFCNQLEKVNFEEEFNKKDRFTHLRTIDQFKSFWESKLLIESAIIPPENIFCNEEYKNEPRKAWQHMNQYCGGYTWCAYSSIGNGKNKQNKGLVISYSKKEKQYYRKLGEIWMSDYNYSPS